MGPPPAPPLTFTFTHSQGPPPACFPSRRASPQAGEGRELPSAQLPVTTRLQCACALALGWGGHSPGHPPSCSHTQWTCPPGYGPNHPFVPQEGTRPPSEPHGSQPQAICVCYKLRAQENWKALGEPPGPGRR